MDPDRLTAAVLSATWPEVQLPPAEDIPGQVEWLRGMMEDACDFAMPRARPKPRRAAYWWSAEIAELRRSSVAARRRFTKVKGRGDEARTEEALGAYRLARNPLSAVR